MFAGRKRELQKLEKLYQDSGFEFVVFYGRRRIGKTTLIQEFLKEKPGIYYMAVEGTMRENLAGLSRVILAADPVKDASPQFGSFSDLLDYVDRICGNERLILAIDEYPYLAASYPAISSMIQSHIDHCWKNSRLFLILCGSSMSFMENQVLGYKSPLYGRRTAQFKIHPFTFFEAREMLEGFSAEDQAVLYGVTGGVPEYLSRVRRELSLDENIVRLFFDESGRLFEEPSNLLKQELKEPATYQSIISSIAGGASRLNEIATATGLETSGCSSQLSSLISIGIVRKEVPFTENERSRRTLYRLEDNMFLFWYRFVRPNVSTVARGMGEAVYDALVKPRLNHFMGSIFEEICCQYLFLPEIYPALPFPFGTVGRWWGPNPVKKCQEEIDLMSVFERSAWFGECKWRNEMADMDILEKLLERGELFSYPDKWYAVFSKAGFRPEVYEHEECRKGRVKLVSFQEMAQI